MDVQDAPLVRPARGLKDDKTFKKAITLILAGLTITTSLIVMANVRSSSRGAEAGRDARILSFRYLTHLGKADWNLAAEKDLLAFRQELVLMTDQAQMRAALAQQPADAVFYGLSGDRLARISGLLAKEGELTQPPYFSPEGGADFLQYLQDKIFVPAAEILERQEQKKSEGAFYGAISSALTSGLAVMAVAVFLLTLSLVLGGRIRYIMAGSGLAITVAVLVFSAVTEARSWRSPSEGAIRTLARATGYLTRAQILFGANGDTTPALAAAAQAEADIDRVLASEPDYLSAIQTKARIRSIKGEALFYGGRMEESRPDLEKAVADYDRLIAAGLTPGYNFWSRGYAEYLLGRHDACERSFEQALKLLPEQGFRMGVVRAAGLVIGGKVPAAREALEAAVEFARTKPMASDALIFRVFIQNLERFQELRPTAGLPGMILRLKEASVSLAALGLSRPGPERTEISTPRFVIDDTPCDAFPRFTIQADFLMELKGMERDQSIVRKVFRRAPGLPFWTEQRFLGRTQYWDTDASEARIRDDVETVLPEADGWLASGDYRLEIYVNGRLKASAAFKIL